MNNQQKKILKKDYEQRLKRKTQNRINLLVTFIVLFACLIGHTRGLKKSVLAIFINNPSEGFPYLIIVITGVLIFYFVMYAIAAKKYK